MSSEKIEGDGFSFEVIRSKRRKKSIALTIRDGEVRVMAPATAPLRTIKAFVAQKSAWVRNNLQQQREAEPVIARQFVSGERFNYLGEPYQLQIIRGSKPLVNVVDDQLQVQLRSPATADKTHRLLERWYRQQAQLVLEKKTRHYAKIVKAEPTLVRVKSYRARWGSCSSRGEINYNWKLIIAPHSVIDYVVIHELCHLHHHNHSPRFWQTVAQIVPKHRRYREWLKQNGRFLVIE